MEITLKKLKHTLLPDKVEPVISSLLMKILYSLGTFGNFHS